VGLDEPVGQLDDRRASGGGAEGLEQRGAVLQLVLQREVAEQRLGEGLALLQVGLGQRGDPSGGGVDDVRHAALFPQHPGDRRRTEPAVVGVLGELALHRLGPGLGPAGLGDLDLGLGETEQGAELSDDHGLLGSHPGTLRRRGRSSVGCPKRHGSMRPEP
jgi:hypothetical protein